MIEIKNLSFKYSDKQILKNINLHIKQGVTCGILGPNGCGKSTFFKCILNVLKTQAQIKINGKDIKTLSPSKISKEIAYVAQHNDISFNFTAFDVVLMGINPSFGGIFGISKDDKKFVLKMIEKVGMKGYENYDFNALSGGQKQLILIARALAMKTPIIILDEPTSALDFKNAICIWKIIDELSKDGKTILVCTHDPNHIMWFCDKVVVFYDGEILVNGDSADVLTKQIIDKIYDNGFVLSYAENIKTKTPKIIHPIL